MSNEYIKSLPYKELLYEMERRRKWLEANRDTESQRQLEKQMKDIKKK